jgi:hypothetical protein
MPISVKCPKCDKAVKVADTLAGRAFKCPGCTTVIKVPGGSSASVAAAAGAKSKAASNGSGRSAPLEKKPARRPDPEEAEEELEEITDEPRSRKSSRRDDDDDDYDRPRTRSIKKELDIEHDVPEHLQERVTEELTKGEKLIWIGQPARRVLMVRSIPIVIFGCIFGLGALIFMLVGLVGSRGMGGAPFILMPLFFLPFAIGMILSPWYRFWMAKRTCYVLTNRRCIVWMCNWFGGVHMENYNAAQLANMWRRDMWFFGKGAGDLVFRSVTTITVRTGRHGGVSQSTTYYGFLAIENVREIEKLVRETLVDRFMDKLNS